MKKYEELTFRDQFMFAKVTKDPENCKRVLDSLLDMDIELSSNPIVEKFIQERADGKFIRLDLYAEDDFSRVFDAEMQNESENIARQRELPKRSRYYQSALDMFMLNSGVDYEKLKETFIIFICTFDPFGKGLYRYTFNGKCDECDDLYLDDKATRIFFNTKGDLSKAPESTRSFLEYVETGKVSNDVTKHLDEAIQEAIRNAMWREDYMLSVLWRDEAITEGRKEGLEEGRKAGREEGREEIRHEMLLKMITQGCSKDFVLDMGFTEEEYDSAVNN